jgi:tripartite-type tricarboxylate transporter receptor subunit TctC
MSNHPEREGRVVSRAVLAQPAGEKHRSIARIDVNSYPFPRTTECRQKTYLRCLVVLLVFGVTVVLACGASAQQEQYPCRPIDLICTFGPGGGADMMARQVSSLIQPILGVALPVSNIPGASGNVAITQLLGSKPDGYTLATYLQDTLMTIPMGLARHKIDEIEWLVRTQVADSFLFVKPDSPFKTIQDLFRYAQANPGKLRVAATGFATPDDVTVRYLGKMGYKMTTVPYTKPGERYAAALGGHTEVLYEQAGDVKQYVEAGQLKPLIIFAEKRAPAFPDVPTSLELGLDITLPQFRGIVAKKGLPADRVRMLTKAIGEAMDTQDWKKFAEQWYIRPDSYMGPQEYGQWVEGEVATLNRLVREFGLRK